MPRSMRIQLVAGLVTGIVGMAITVLGPIAVYFLTPKPSFSPGDAEGMSHFMEAAQWFSTVATIVAVTGLVLAAAGPLYSFAVWADWSIGRRGTENNQAPQS
jgi:hypothetical protein